MKKQFGIAMIALSAAMAFTFTACNDDSSSAKGPEKVSKVDDLSADCEDGDEALVGDDEVLYTCTDGKWATEAKSSASKPKSSSSKVEEEEEDECDPDLENCDDDDDENNEEEVKSSSSKKPSGGKGDSGSGSGSGDSGSGSGEGGSGSGSEEGGSEEGGSGEGGSGSETTSSQSSATSTADCEAGQYAIYSKYKGGNKLNIIKFYMELTGEGLKESKDYVEKFAENEYFFTSCVDTETQYNSSIKSAKGYNVRTEIIKDGLSIYKSGYCGEKEFNSVLGGTCESDGNYYFTETSSGTTTYYFEDLRDHSTYSYITKFTTKIMTQNLRYVNGSVGQFASASETESDKVKYGAFYSFAEAKSVCPSGWRLMKTADYEKLFQGNGSETEDFDFDGGISFSDKAEPVSNLAYKFKSTTDWTAKTGVPTGTNSSGFNVYPAGDFSLGGSTLTHKGRGSEAYIWMDKEFSPGQNAYAFRLLNSNDQIKFVYMSETLNKYSVRCAK